MYDQEIDLIADVEVGLKSPGCPFPKLRWAEEFNYKNGKVDLIGGSDDGLLIALEAKLLRWKDALNQAYRNSAFAHLSYVILPRKSVERALVRRHEFERRGVGLCSIENSTISIEIDCQQKESLQPWLTESALHFILGDKNGSTAGRCRGVQK